MLSRQLQDLRFIIGVFFGTLGLIVMATGLFDPTLTAEGAHLDCVGAGMMLALAVLMLALSFGKREGGDGE